MYYMFSLIFIILVVESVTIKHLFQDHHPFIQDDDNVKNETDKDKFMLIPSIGYEMNNEPDKFTLIFNGWYYEPLTPDFLQSFIKNSFHATLDIFSISESYTKAGKEERLGPFFVRDVSDHKIQLKLSESISQIVTTDNNGRFHEKIIVDSLEGLNIQGEILKYMASDDDTDHKQENEGIIYLMRKKTNIGCSIISDIDDTIKISEVPDKKKLIINTFKKDFKAVPGMSDVYRSWQSLDKCLIHYVSAMPSQLYYVTQKFLNKENFPGGSFHMRHLKLVSSDKYKLIKKIIEFIKHDASQKHKLTVIQDILDHAPITQQFVMVGDSGELDPEIYGTIARKYSDRIKMIFIRRVDGGNNNNIRFETAFKDVSEDKWRSFSNANELPKKLYEDDTADPDSLDNGIILSTSLLCIILPMLITFLFII